MFAVWLYHPTFKGALFMNQKAEKFYPIVFKQLELVGKYLFFYVLFIL